MKIKKILSVLALSGMLVMSSVISPLQNVVTINAQTFLRSTSKYNSRYSCTTIIDYEYDGNTGRKSILSAYTYSSNSNYRFYTNHSSTNVYVVAIDAKTNYKLDDWIYCI